MDIRNIYICVIGFFSFVFGGKVYAQNTIVNENLKFDVKQYCDSISTLRQQIYSDSIRDCNISPQLYKLLSPSIYYRKTINDYLKITDVDKEKGNIYSRNTIYINITIVD